MLPVRSEEQRISFKLELIRIILVVEELEIV